MTTSGPRPPARPGMLATIWTGSPPLAATGTIMLGLLAVYAAGLLVDSRTITGAPAWLKPAKFAASIAIYTFTLAWIFSLLPTWTRLRRRVGWTTAVVMAIEMAIITAQAARGTTSHFNVSTLTNALLVGTMGIAIVVQTLTTIAVAIALWRERFDDAALGWALRFGMILTIAGAFTGGLMTQPTTEQLEAARAGTRMTVAGAHTVGAPDGGPGMPGTGWSTEHGDLRVPHFVGLHAVQALPLLALFARRRVAEAQRVRLVFVATASYTSLFAILLSQALRGEPVIAPGVATLSLLAAWALVTAVAATASSAHHGSARSAAVV